MPRQPREKSESGIYHIILRGINQQVILEDYDDYKFSSYNDYIDEESDVVDFDFALSILPKPEFMNFNNESNDDVCLDITAKDFRINDVDARRIIKKVSKCENATEFQALSQSYRDIYIKKFKQKGLSIRQISRLTGISKGIVEKIH